MKFTVFFSWQSDIKKNRNILENNIEKGLRQCKDIGIFNLISDSRGKSGAPDIAQSLFDKIRTSDIYIADLTIINKSIFNYICHKRLTPNPNVMAEIGYAYKALGGERMILFYNEDYTSPEELPFDINHLLCTPFSKHKTNGIVSKVKDLIISLNNKGKLKNIIQNDEERNAQFDIEFLIDDEKNIEEVYKNTEYGQIDNKKIYLTLRNDVNEKKISDYCELNYNQEAKSLGITKNEIDEYNNALPSKNEIETYVAEYNNYYRCQNNAIPLEVIVHNNGSKKATNVRVKIRSSNDIIKILDLDEIEDIELPKELKIPNNPIEEAKNKVFNSMIQNNNLMYENIFKGFNNYTDLQIAQPKYKSIIKHINNISIHQSIVVNNNIINIWVDELLHKDNKVFKHFAFVPLKKGETILNISIICDDYSEPIELNYEVFVR